MAENTISPSKIQVDKHLAEVRDMLEGAGGRQFNTIPMDETGHMLEIWNVNGRPLMLQIFANNQGWEIFVPVVHTNVVSITKKALREWLEDTKKK